MSKIIKKFEIDHNLNWAYDCIPIKQLREDLDAIEKLGATHVEIDMVYYGDPFIEIKVYSERMETDKEYEARINDDTINQERIKRDELAQLEKLKAKYGL